MKTDHEMKGRRGFLKRLLGAFVAPKVVEALPVPVAPVRVIMPKFRQPGCSTLALGEWLGRRKAEEMRQHLLHGKPLPMRYSYGVEDEPEEEDAEA